jgi:hypothetical protein
LLVPHTDAHRVRAARDNEGHLVLEALLGAPQGKDVVLDGLGKRRDAVGLSLQGNRASTQSNLRGCRLRGVMVENPT